METEVPFPSLYFLRLAMRIVLAVDPPFVL